MSSVNENHIENDGDNFSLIGINYALASAHTVNHIWGRNRFRDYPHFVKFERNKSVMGSYMRQAGNLFLQIHLLRSIRFL